MTSIHRTLVIAAAPDLEDDVRAGRERGLGPGPVTWADQVVAGGQGDDEVRLGQDLDQGPDHRPGAFGLGLEDLHLAPGNPVAHRGGHLIAEGQIMAVDDEDHRRPVGGSGAFLPGGVEVPRNRFNRSGRSP